MLSSKNLLFAEKPYVTALAFGDVEKRMHCWSCLKVGKCLICSKCHIAAYCSKECQKEDWITTKQHKHECNVFQKADQAERELLLRDPVCSVELRFVGRLLARKNEDGGIQPEQDRFRFPENAVVRSLVDVPTSARKLFTTFHCSHRKISKKEFADQFKGIYGKRSEFYSRISRDDVMYAYSLTPRIENRRKVDGITDVAKLGDLVGVSLFMQMSRFRYSCDPDVVRIEENGISYFKLLKPEKQSMDLDRLTIGNQVHELEPKIVFEATKPFLKKDVPNTISLYLDKECSYCNDTDGLMIRRFSIKEKCPDCGKSLVFDPKNPPAKCLQCQSPKVISVTTKRAVTSALKLQDLIWKEEEEGGMKIGTRFKMIQECFNNLDPVRCINLQSLLICLLHDVKKYGLRNVDVSNCDCGHYGEMGFVTCFDHMMRQLPMECMIAFISLQRLAKVLDPEGCLVKKYADRYRPFRNSDYVLPVMEVVRQGMAFHGLRLYDAIPLKVFMCDVYARAGLKMEAMEIAESVRETMVLCYHEEHPKVKEWDTRLQELSRAQ